MKKSKLLLSSCALFTLSACAGQNAVMDDILGGEKGVEWYPPIASATHPHSNKVMSASHEQTVLFSKESCDMGSAEADMRSFLSKVDPLSYESVYISVGEHVQPCQLQYVARALRTEGVARRDMTIVQTETLAPLELSVIAEYSTTSIPACPDWTTGSRGNDDNTLYSNYGCAYYGNIGQMIARPVDMIKHTKRTPITAGRSNVILGNYQSGADITVGGGGAEEAAE